MKIFILIIIPIISFAQTSFVKPEKNDTLIPKGYYLERYYPNPFCPVTWTVFGIPDSCSIKMFIRDSTNKTNIDTIYVGKLGPGNYKYDYEHIVVNSKRYAGFIGNLYLEAADIKSTPSSIFISSTKFIWFKY